MKFQNLAKISMTTLPIIRTMVTQGTAGEKTMSNRRRLFCRECGDHREIIEYTRDDPILSCGHIKQRVQQDDQVHAAQQEIERILIEDAKTRQMTVEQVRTEFTNSLLEIFTPTDKTPTIGHCETCGKTTIYIDKDGTKRCGGNLLDNPGCGMPILVSTI
jgi:hypothetical protein